MARLELHVGAAEFWVRAQSDIAAAKNRLFVQAMTFEGDAAGLAVARAITASPADDRRVLVDDYSRFSLSDRSLFATAFGADPNLRAEARDTRAMFADLTRAGVRVRRTNPVGPLAWNWPGRNHKKLIVADEVAWIGGVNFSDHNFAWDDLMLRLEGAAEADWLAADFAATFASVPAPGEARWPDLTLVSLDGRTNRHGFGRVFRAIEEARRAITVVSPYATFPFTDHLARAARRGVKIVLITPAASNKPLVSGYLTNWARRTGIETRLTPTMIHLKGMMIDGDRLVIGSSNFDFVSVAAEEELVAIIDDPAVAADFQSRVIEPALAAAALSNTAGIGSTGPRAPRCAWRRFIPVSRVSPTSFRDIDIGVGKSAVEIQRRILAAYQANGYEPPSDYSRWSRFLSAGTGRQGHQTGAAGS